MDSIHPIFTAYFAQKPHFDYRSETYGCWVLFALTRGSFRYRIGDESGPYTTANQHELVLCPPGLPFYREAAMPMTLYMIKFSGIHSIRAGKYSISDTRRLRQNLQILESETVCADLSARPRLAHYCMDIWYQLCDSAGPLPHNELPCGSSLKKVTDFICANLQAKLRTDQLAAFCGYSQAHMIALFRKELHTTPGKYIADLRLSKAAHLLTQTDAKIKAIASACGYEDELYFSRAFKQHTGLCPTQYRTSAKL